MGDSCGNKRFSMHLADNERRCGQELDVFVVKVAAVTERERIGGEKTSIRPDNRQTRRAS